MEFMEFTPPEAHKNGVCECHRYKGGEGKDAVRTKNTKQGRKVSSGQTLIFGASSSGAGAAQPWCLAHALIPTSVAIQSLAAFVEWATLNTGKCTQIRAKSIHIN